MTISKESKVTGGHTPGPWELHSPTDGEPKTGDGTYCVTGWHGGVIAEITPKDGRNTPDNARLIAAAPELLAALKSMVDFLENGSDGWGARDYRIHEDNVVADAESAIAQAEEESK